MKKVFRYEDNRQYWDRRWTEASSDKEWFVDLNIYPIKYAEMVMNNASSYTLELGAGLGRILKHYHYAGHKIFGLELSNVAVRRLKSENVVTNICGGDVRNLPYADGQYDVVLGFGLYHNLEEGMDRALSETARCLKAGGRFCISMRPNNLEMNLNEWYWKWRQISNRRREKKFHKWLVGEREFGKLLGYYKLQTTEIHRARNFSLLYRVPWLRDKSVNEAESRAKGYRLNMVGRLIDGVLTRSFPSQFCNVLVFIGNKMT